MTSADVEAVPIVDEVEAIYEQHIKKLSVAARLHLLALVARNLAEAQTQESAQPKRSIMELHGLGAQIWEGIDAQEYVNQLRSEWDHRP